MTYWVIQKLIFLNLINLCIRLPFSIFFDSREPDESTFTLLWYLTSPNVYQATGHLNHRYSFSGKGRPNETYGGGLAPSSQIVGSLLRKISATVSSAWFLVFYCFLKYHTNVTLKRASLIFIHLWCFIYSSEVNKTP